MIFKILCSHARKIHDELVVEIHHLFRLACPSSAYYRTETTAKMTLLFTKGIDVFVDFQFLFFQNMCYNEGKCCSHSRGYHRTYIGNVHHGCLADTNGLPFFLASHDSP